MKTVEIPDGSRGFDCNEPLSRLQAETAKAHGYAFVGRYVPRVTRHPTDLTAAEVTILTAAGLGVFAVQHVEDETSWQPSPAKGSAYGAVAALEAMHCGLPAGVTVACDLEGIAIETPHATVSDYCRAWFEAVHDAGFLPALYVGWHSLLTPAELFALPFTRYWGALNLDVDQFPATRGVCMKQHEEQPGDRPQGVAFPIDTDTATADALGGRMTMAIA